MFPSAEKYIKYHESQWILESNCSVTYQESEKQKVIRSIQLITLQIVARKKARTNHDSPQSFAFSIASAF